VNNAVLMNLRVCVTLAVWKIPLASETGMCMVPRNWGGQHEELERETLLTSWNYSDSRQDSGILEKIFHLDNNDPQRFPVSNYEHE
jgi:hypothetical protein